MQRTQKSNLNVFEWNNSGYQAHHKAALKSTKDVLKGLLDLGLDPLTPTLYEQYTLLHLSALNLESEHRLELFEFLIGCSTSDDAKDTTDSKYVHDGRKLINVLSRFK